LYSFEVTNPSIVTLDAFVFGIDASKGATVFGMPIRGDIIPLSDAFKPITLGFPKDVLARKKKASSVMIKIFASFF
jgi:hypothetical protein